MSELVSVGYPMRPKAVTYGGQTYRELVSQPTAIVQPKYDGMRVLAVLRPRHKPLLYTRQLEPVRAMRTDHIVRWLERVQDRLVGQRPHLILDGELMHSGLYNVFDAPTVPGALEVRLMWLVGAFAPYRGPVGLSPHRVGEPGLARHIDSWLSERNERGRVEGVVIKGTASPYRWGNSATATTRLWLKAKP